MGHRAILAGRCDRVTGVRRSRLLAWLLLTLVGACSGETVPPPGTAFTAVHDGVCAALEAGRAGDQARAGREFADVHAGLHDLAAAVEEEDRAATARLLEHKQRAEAALGGERPDSATPELEALVDAIRGAIAATGQAPPPRCPA